MTSVRKIKTFSHIYIFCGYVYVSTRQDYLPCKRPSSGLTACLMLEIAAASVTPVVYPLGLLLQAVIIIQHLRLHVLEIPLNKTLLELE